MEEKKGLAAQKKDSEQRKTDRFEIPSVRTFTGNEIKTEIGPAQMCSPSPCPLSP